MRFPALFSSQAFAKFGGVASAGLLVVALGACSSSKDPNDPSNVQPTGAYNGNNGQYNPNGGQYNPNGTNPTGGGTVPATTNTTPAPASGGGSAQAIPPAAAMAATPALQVLAGRDAQGMSADGPAFAGNFQQGQTLEQVVNVQANKCYTVVAAGVGITQLDIVVTTAAPPPIPSVPVAQSSTQGPNATVGGGGNCMRSLVPAQFKVVLKATAGAGIAVAQVFSK